MGRVSSGWRKQMQGLDLRYLGTWSKSPNRLAGRPGVVSPPVLSCDWLHGSLARGPCSLVGRRLLPQASRNLHLPTNLASSQRPRRALWSNPFSITKHSHPLHPKAKRDASQNRPQPSTTIENYQADLFARDFAAPFVQPLATSPPIWPASAIFSFRPPAFFPSLAVAHPTPPQPHPQPRAPSISRPPLVRRIASQTKPAKKDPPATTPRPAYAIRRLCQRDTALLCIPASTALRHPGPIQL